MLEAYLSALFHANNLFWRTAMIHVGMDVHIRNSVLNAKTEDGQGPAPGRWGNTTLELSGFFAPFGRRAKALGEWRRVVVGSDGHPRVCNAS